MSAETKLIACPECGGDGHYQAPAPDFDPTEWDLTCECCSGNKTIAVKIHRTLSLTRAEHDALLTFLQSEFVRRYWRVLDDPRGARARAEYADAKRALTAYYGSEEQALAFRYAAQRAWEERRDRKENRLPARMTALDLEVEQRR